MKVVTIVGARPQFIKASAVSRELRKQHREVLVHTGQHYDYTMSGVFFDGLELPAPDINLAVGSGSHGAQTGAMLKGIEDVLESERPDWVLIYGDTNSTLAGALAAAKLHIRIAHVEAGLRSFNRAMPKEINRVVADHLSTLLLCPSQTAVGNLAAEGVRNGVHLVGDVMLDVLNWAREKVATRPPGIKSQLGLCDRSYLVTTVHRSENTDSSERLQGILTALNSLNEPVVFPVHPRARKAIESSKLTLRSHVRLIEPLGYLEMVALTSAARAVLTDSGGLQKEAYWLGVPCITLRDETEWVETVATGWNRLAGTHSERIVEAVRSMSPEKAHPVLYGDAQVTSRTVALLAAGNGTHDFDSKVN